MASSTTCATDLPIAGRSATTMFVSTSSGFTDPGTASASTSAMARAFAWSSASRSTLFRMAYSAGRGQYSRLPPAGAEPLAPDPGFLDQLSRPDQDRPDRSAEALRQTNTRGRRPAAVSAHRYAGRDRGVPQPGAVQVQRHPGGVQLVRQRVVQALAWIVPPPKLCVFSTETAAVVTKYGPRSGAISVADLLEVDQSGRVRPGPRGDAAHRGVGPELGPGDMRAGLAEHLAAERRQGPDTEDVRQRPGDDEEAGLVTEQPGDLGLQLGDGRVLAVHVVADVGLSSSPSASPRTAG